MELGQMARTPIVLVGKEFWQPVIDFLRQKSSQEVLAVPESEMAQWQVVDDAASAFEFIKDSVDRPQQLRRPLMIPAVRAV